MNPLSLIRQWFSLLFRGELELLHLGRTEIETYLTTILHYQTAAVYIQEAIYSPLLDTIQVVAKIPAPDYGDFRHITAEQYIRVISQTVYILCRCLHTKGTLDITILKNDPESTYYRETNLRYQRLTKPDELFVVTVGLTRVRELRNGIWQMKIAVTDGPFNGEIDGVLVPGGTISLSDPEMAEACYTIWQEFGNRLRSTVLRFATRRISRRLQKGRLFLYPVLSPI